MSTIDIVNPATPTTSTPPAASTQERVRVAWPTVVLFTAVLSFADSYWLISLRGAVGAIERTQSPFTAWWHESILTLPIFALAVLAALTLAQHWFGPLLRGGKAVITALALLTTAGTLTGIGQMIASAAFDYHLQAAQLQAMGSMDGLCNRACIAAEQHDTLSAHIRGVLYVSRWLLLTNLVLIAWIVAFLGGRIRTGTTRPATSATTRTAARLGAARTVLVAALLGSAAIHAAVIPEHLAEWAAAGTFFVLLTAAELGAATLLLTRIREHTTLLAIVLISVGPLAIWAWSRGIGLPLGPEPGTTEAIGLPDLAACALELVALIVAGALLARRPRRRVASAYVTGMIVIAVIAVTALGLAATEVSWLNVFGTGAAAMSGMH